ncbi:MULTISPECIES: DUF3040 domain-containing protein [unclassified Arthrobacter]|uniref:DUF3040 domain-containing protein n=1 Tax=unclassified Arthrobacter TaxID=235627 RepID=UPI0021083DB3|nr:MULTISPECIES: DUF3040 domain-containing protein [unclassified Arthrobacter]MCQ1946576.1 DUF3040 domain-containing protein [Arthrobacter sp. zg-Y1116]MCQ1987289.1 DUF3040 domain-containing protein [Arthrobacter sp. zg-Y844]MCQ1995952.1 DUF3040 domain-containing protein [Arthrobacter sp. zg-Y1171]UWX82970.1 DUF3040 domain-containing protein [Arthrobacter sp. zg-Y1171]
MALSEHEQRLLDQLEQQLHAEDPKFANSMATSAGRGISTRRIVLGALLAVVGLGVLLLGITEAGILVGVLGFLIMGAGVYYATTRGRKNAPAATDGRKERESSTQRGFMNNLESKWDERKRDQP